MEHHKDPAMAQSILDDLKKIENDGYDLVAQMHNELKKLRAIT
jgi:hypothetical protein